MGSLYGGDGLYVVCNGISYMTGFSPYMVYSHMSEYILLTYSDSFVVMACIEISFFISLPNLHCYDLV